MRSQKKKGTPQEKRGKKNTHILHERKLVSGHGVPTSQLSIDFEAQVSHVLDLGRHDMFHQHTLQKEAISRKKSDNNGHGRREVLSKFKHIQRAILTHKQLCHPGDSITLKALKKKKHRRRYCDVSCSVISGCSHFRQHNLETVTA